MPSARFLFVSRSSWQLSPSRWPEHSRDHPDSSAGPGWPGALCTELWAAFLFPSKALTWILTEARFLLRGWIKSVITSFLGPVLSLLFLLSGDYITVAEKFGPQTKWISNITPNGGWFVENVCKIQYLKRARWHKSESSSREQEQHKVRWCQEGQPVLRGAQPWHLCGGWRLRTNGDRPWLPTSSSQNRKKMWGVAPFIPYTQQDWSGGGSD